MERKMIVILLCLGSAFAYPDSSDWGQGGTNINTNCSCGWTNTPSSLERIHGGEDTFPNQFPSMVGITKSSSSAIMCGGVLITASHVLTAAHCKPHDFDTYPDNWVAVVGEHDINATSSHRVRHAISSWTPHANYNESGMEENDIALIYLTNPVTLTNFVGPSCFPDVKQNLVGQQVILLGWGNMWYNNYQTETLQMATVRVRPMSACAYFFKEGTHNDSQICTYSFGRDACPGDSGGPLLWRDPSINRYVVVGIVSYGSHCGSDTPSVNTDVAHFRNWILAAMLDAYHTTHFHTTSPKAHTCQKVVE